MPLYDFQHVLPLTDVQKDELASTLTALHTAKFKVPRLFVNVYFTNISDRSPYVGGKRRPANHVVGRVRLGDRKKEDLQQLAHSIEQAWEEIVVRPQANKAGSETYSKTFKLQTIILTPINSVGLEAGFDLPVAGEDGLWLKNNFPEFKRRADAGDKDMKETVAEIRERALL